jgi:predicted transcriptional regulator
MEIHFTPDQEARLSQVADHSGTDAEQLVKDIVMRTIEEDERFRAAVRRGIEEADRGELIPHDEVATRLERLLQR